MSTKAGRSTPLSYARRAGYADEVLRGLVLVVAVCACNQVLDLEPPERETLVDTDGDGFVDAEDNCPTVANDQTDTDDDRRGDACDQCPLAKPTRDRDGDGLDDACDSCLLGPQIDDDGDGVMDACDLCPATATTIQMDVDGDLIGDECDSDRSGGDNERVLFDAFAPFDPGWMGAASWQLAPDGSSLIPTAPTALLWRAPPKGTLLTISAMFELMPDSVVGLSLGGPSDPVTVQDLLLRCELRCSGGECRLHAESTNGPVASSPIPMARAAIKASVYQGMMANAELTCGVYARGQLPMTISLTVGTDASRLVTVSASSGARLLGVDFIE